MINRARPIGQECHQPRELEADPERNRPPICLLQRNEQAEEQQVGRASFRITCAMGLRTTKPCCILFRTGSPVTTIPFTIICAI